jgi:hypothetical protein
MTNSAQDRLQVVMTEITAYQEELRLLREAGRTPTVSDLQRYGDAAERWKLELGFIRSQVWGETKGAPP